MSITPEQAELLKSTWDKFINRECNLKQLLEATKPYEEFNPQIFVPLVNFKQGTKEKDVILLDSSAVHQPHPTNDERTAFEDAWTRFSAGKCELRELVKKAGMFDWNRQLAIPVLSIRKAISDGMITLYDPAKDAHPAYKGTEEQRTQGMTYHPQHPKGKFIASIKSKALIGAINQAHKMILKGYDMNAFVFKDQRRKAQYDFFYNYIWENFNHRWGEYKPEFMTKILQIIFFLLKEDIYYCRIIDMIERMPRFGMNEAEQKNIDMFHKWQLKKE